MADGEVSYTTLATGEIGGNSETTYSSYMISNDLFTLGENIIAVEIHQGEVISSDIGFDLELVATKKTLLLESNIGPLIQNNWQTFTWPYNAYYPEYESGANGHMGNACGPTAIARLIHYWHHTTNGLGRIQATDSYHNLSYDCNFENLNLDYSNMPGSLDGDASESEYEQVAKLMYACGTIGEDIGIGYIGSHSDIAPALVNHFYFKEGATVVYRNDYTKAEWQTIFLTELSEGRPILITGRTEDSPAPGESGTVSGHYFICDGVNTDGLFYYNYMFSNIKGYADIDEMGVYKTHHYAIIGLEPDYNRVPTKTGDIDDVAVVPTFTPNPASDIIRLSVKERYSLMIYNLSGTCVMQGDYLSPENVIDVSMLESGLYVLVYKYFGETYHQKLFVE